MFEIQKISNCNLTISCDPDVIDDLVLVLSKLLDFAKLIKLRKKYLEAETKSQNTAALKARQARYEAICQEVYSKYLELLKTSETPSKAVKETAKWFGLLRYEAEIDIAGGKRLEKARRKPAPCRPGNQKDLITTTTRKKAAAKKAKALPRDIISATTWTAL
ncbi:MAG: hypothetical protein M0033_10115 [Nitrospiraceae bacterium]|nr:hypothetical protein [Nitrospiraceae bacterium]